MEIGSRLYRQQPEVELLHNFSLIHDDVEDNGDLRHGRSTVWGIWGVPQAINAGDLMFTISNQAILRLKQSYSADVVLQAQELFQQTCVKLTQGQYLDMWYENLGELPLDAYWSMVAGKTGCAAGLLYRDGSVAGRCGQCDVCKISSVWSFAGLAFRCRMTCWAFGGM